MTLNPIPETEFQKLRRSVLAQLEFKGPMDAARIAVGLNHSVCFSKGKPKPDSVAEQVIQSLVEDGSIVAEKFPWEKVPLYILVGVFSERVEHMRKLASEIKKKSQDKTDPIVTKLEKAIEALEKQGEPFTLAELCLHAKLPTNTIFRHKYRDIKERAKVVSKALRDAKPTKQTQSAA